MLDLVTGANRGIGLEFCKQLKERGDEVIAVCRTSSPELDALGVRVERDVDIGSDESVKRLAGRLGDVRIDLLLNNAGIMRHVALANLDSASVREQIEVNAIGPLRLTSALLDRLRDGAKIALITSRMGSIGDNTSGGSYGYRMSKAALNMAGVSMALDLKDRGITVAVLHPGFVRTRLTGDRGNVEPRDAVKGLIARIDEVTPATSGTFWHASGERLRW